MQQVYILYSLLQSKSQENYWIMNHTKQHDKSYWACDYSYWAYDSPMPTKRVLCTLCFLDGGNSLQECMTSGSTIGRHIDNNHEKCKKNEELIKRIEKKKTCLF